MFVNSGNEILAAPVFLSVVGGISSLFLAIADILFAVRKNPRAEIIEKILPGLNCGACGFASCASYAEAMASKATPPGLCRAVTGQGLEVLREIFGGLEKEGRRIAIIKCSGGSIEKFKYDGIPSCSAAELVSGGMKACSYGCLGFGDCAAVCPVGAIGISEANSIVWVDSVKCTGCGLCVAACPRNIIELKPVSHAYYVACASEDKSEVRNYCKNGCFSCGICTGKKFNPYGIIEMKNNIPVVLWDRVKDIESVKAAGEKCPVKVWKKIKTPEQ